MLVWPDAAGGFDVVPWFWLPAASLEKRAAHERHMFDQWIAAGHLTATEGTIVDYDVIRRDLNALGDRFAIQEIGFDPWNATQLATQLGSDGFQLVQMRQGHRILGEPTRRLGELVVGQRIRHGGHPVLRWMATHLVVRTDAHGNVCPDKPRATDRIDGIVATIMALGRAIVQPGVTSVYSAERGVQSIAW